MIGVEIAKMHLADIIHGDLTTSNMMLREGSKGSNSCWFSVLLYDGRGQSSWPLCMSSNALLDQCIQTQSRFSVQFSTHDKHLGKHWSAIKKRLDDGCLRGRKRSVVG
ncbi:hypothetical protein EDC04DRAFT_1288853 [Pisolithus marmoratus]|nr:hypothetical protein EDC04DRAFT_1288853 [Pisolithus marmoratus]